MKTSGAFGPAGNKKQNKKLAAVLRPAPSTPTTATVSYIRGGKVSIVDLGTACSGNDYFHSVGGC